jgi:hypothetical protein
MLLTWLYIVCTLIVLLIRSGHTELLIRSGYAAILFATTIGPAVAKATWRHCLSHFIDRVAARTCCAANVMTSRISFLFSWPWWIGSVVKHNMLKCWNSWNPSLLCTNVMIRHRIFRAMVYFSERGGEMVRFTSTACDLVSTLGYWLLQSLHYQDFECIISSYAPVLAHRDTRVRWLASDKHTLDI